MTYAQPMADPTNVVGRRIGAYAIDLVVMLILIFALVYPIFLSASTTAPSGTVSCAGSTVDNNTFDEPRFRRSVDSPYCFEVGNEVRYIARDDADAFTAKAYGIGFGVQALNLVLLQGLTGASLGKLMVGLRVVRQDGRTAGPGWAALRWVVLFVDSLCCFLPGAILVFTTKGHRRLGDMAAGTFVVPSRAVGTPPQVPGVTTPVGWAPSGPSVPGYPTYPGQPTSSWGAGPGDPGGWAGPPTAGPSGTWSPTGAATAPAAGVSGDGPTWDGARNAYIQYDREQGAWLQWDNDAQQWRPIDQ